jgi:phage FluMu protein Com
MSNYTEKHLLPSKGLLNPEITPEIVLRNMTTSDEKTLLGSTPDALDIILKNCIVSPKDLVLEELISPDKHFLLLKLRVISYGSDYFVSVKCPSCGATPEYKINLDSLPLDYLPDDFQDPYDSFELPMGKQVIELKIPKVKDLNEADVKSRRFHKKYSEVKGDMSYIYRLMANVYSVDGKELSPSELQAFIENMSSMDASYMKNRMNKLKVGIDTEIMEECPKCHADHKFELPITYEFFRTRFED